ncbi:hypothetical protein OG249_37410 [Streptomyces microflavus]|uniref:hypothetical protein n=1 Tax=Streptomyces microflavus TaxID=1919 RepID=UPI0022529AD6|nr:hypothetical protein [Streptomyces microflavus]MCX4657538.1 hypothetical protein [Streptomyces microflavus]
MSTRTTCGANSCTAVPVLLEPVPLCQACAIAVALAVVPQLLAVTLSEALAAQAHAPAPAAEPQPDRPVPGQGVALRSDEELIAMIRTMPTDPGGCLPPTRVREHLGCRTGRAVRLMRIVGVLRPEDDPELTTVPRTS